MSGCTVGHGVGFERTRRITGYCASTQRFCDAKRAELKDRVLHVGLPATCTGFKFPTWEQQGAAS